MSLTPGAVVRFLRRDGAALNLRLPGGEDALRASAAPDTTWSIDGHVVHLVDQEPPGPTGTHTKWFTEGLEYWGSRVHLPFRTRGPHTIVKRRHDGAEQTIVVATVEEPLTTWATDEYALPLGLVPHTGMLRDRDFGWGRSKQVPAPTLTGPRGPIEISVPRNDARYRWASDYGPGTMDWARLEGLMSQGLGPNDNVWLLYDHEPADGEDVHHYPAPAEGLGCDGYFATSTTGASYDSNGNLIHGSRWAVGATSTTSVEGVESWNGIVHNKGRIGLGRQAFDVPDVVSSRKYRYWLNPAIAHTDLDELGMTMSGTEHGIVTPTMMGNRTVDGSQHELKYWQYWNLTGLILANFWIYPPGGADDGDLATIEGYSGINLTNITDWVFTHVAILGATKGWNGIPPGETTDLAVVRCVGRSYVQDCTINGRRPDGVSVSASPISSANTRHLPGTVWARLTLQGARDSFLTDWETTGVRESIDIEVLDLPAQGYNVESGYYLPGDRHDVVDMVIGTRLGRAVHVEIRNGAEANETRACSVWFVNPHPLNPGLWGLATDTLHRELAEDDITFMIGSAQGYRNVNSNWQLGGYNPLAISTAGGKNPGNLGGGVWRFNKSMEYRGDRVETFDSTGLRIYNPTSPPAYKWPGPRDAKAYVGVIQ